MKKLCCVVISLVMISLVNDASAQILDKIKNKAKQRADQKVDQTIDKGLDEAEGKNKKEKVKTDEEGDVKINNEEGAKSHPQGLKAYSKYDFVPGEKIVYAEDFAQDVVGEFPLKWNTNGTGEVVTIEGLPGKWLQLTAGTKYESPYSNNLPENYTVEFDLVLDFKASMHVPNIEFLIVNNKVKATYLPGMRLMLAPQAGTYSSQDEQNSIDRIRFTSFNEKGERHLAGKDQLIGEFYKYNHKSIPVHVAIWVQKERARVWINQTKVYDLPKAFPAGLVLNNVAIETEYYGSAAENYQYFISNLKIAVAPPDTRSKLITEGKWSTTGILFDVNSDKIKPTSYGTLKEVATILSENADVKVKIIGHTDTDGDDAKNLDLSKRRAAAVKTALSKEFNIDESRLDTDGMGETKPVADNNTSEGKASNRRVEFVKM
ncbi:MAG TPA: OmpA family protein [Chitinophagaceae bacterium]|nr:OmpA family protein [Chitinophagaceae bacterium]